MYYSNLDFSLDPRCLQVPNMVSQVTPGGVSRCIHMCHKNLLFQKLNIRLWFEFFRLKVPQSPLPIYLQKLMFKTCPLP